jgi:glycine betaine/proline transport system substrate-binding protein
MVIDVGLEFWDDGRRSHEGVRRDRPTKRLKRLGRKLKNGGFPNTKAMPETCRTGVPCSTHLRGVVLDVRRRRRKRALRRRAGDAGSFDDERVAALKLPFTVIHAGTDATMFAELKIRLSASAVAIESIRPTGRRLTGANGLNSPEYTPECYNDQNGAEPDAKSRLRQAAWRDLEMLRSGMKDKWPIKPARSPGELIVPTSSTR